MLMTSHRVYLWDLNRIVYVKCLVWNLEHKLYVLDQELLFLLFNEYVIFLFLHYRGRHLSHQF